MATCDECKQERKVLMLCQVWTVEQAEYPILVAEVTVPMWLCEPCIEALGDDISDVDEYATRE